MKRVFVLRVVVGVLALGAPNISSAQISFPSSTGFSSTQGANQWSYLDGNGVAMVYDSTYAGGSWHSTTPTGGDWCYVSSTQQHPGNNTSTKDSIRRWTAPVAGTVSIVGNSKMTGPNGGDGAYVYVRKNASQLFSGFISPSDTTTGQSWSLSTAVSVGDTIDTVVNRYLTYNNDEQAIAQTIKYTQYVPQLASFEFGSAGQLTINATMPRSYFPVPESVRTFSTWEDYGSFLVNELNADSRVSNGVKEVFVDVKMKGDAVYLNSSDVIVPVGCDPVGLFLVGEFGYLTIDGNNYYLDQTGCDLSDLYAENNGEEFKKTRLAGASGACGSGGYCVANATWISGFPWGYRSLGTDAFQTYGAITCIVSGASWPFIKCSAPGLTPHTLTAQGNLLNSSGGNTVGASLSSSTTDDRATVAFTAFAWAVTSEGIGTAPASVGVVFDSAGVCGKTTGVTSLTSASTRSSEANPGGATTCAALP